MRNRITAVLLAGVCLLCVLGVIIFMVGPLSGDPDPDTSTPEGAGGDRDARSDSRAPGFDETDGGDPAEIKRWGSSNPRSDDRGAAPDDAGGGEFAAGGDPDRAEGASEDVIDPSTLPMATKGREMGIDTDFDEDWSPSSEAVEWFQPLQSAFEDSRPLTPAVYNEILGEFRDNTVDVFKRSGEIGEVQGPEKGIRFLEEYNAMVEDYRREAYEEQ